MAYPLTGELGKVNSVTNSTDLDQLLEVATKQNTITYQITGDSADVTGDGATATQHVAGLRGWSLNFTAKWPKAVPRFGHTGLVTRSSGDTMTVSYLERWALNFAFGAIDITSFDGTSNTNPVWRSFRPNGLPVITGTYTARAPNDTALTLPTAVMAAGVPGAGMTGAFRLATETTNHPSFTGTIKATQLSTTFGRANELVKADYSFVVDGALTAVAGDTLACPLPAGVIDASDWGDGTTGPVTVAIVTQSAASRTYTGYGHLESLSITCAVGETVEITGTIRGNGALTLA